VHRRVLDGPVQAVLDLSLPPSSGPTVVRVDVVVPTLVLGSTQRDEVVDRQAAAAAGLEIARRRSGGGAVLHGPGEASWVEVWLPRDDPRWRDDVGRSFRWLGEAWAQVLRDAGHRDVDVHGGPLQQTPWSKLVCFGGLGPGEVTVAGAKVVGIAQHRSRVGARFQCAVLHRWRPATLLAALRLADEDRQRAGEQLAEVARAVDAPSPGWAADALADAIAATSAA
jgi:lipoate-protein ligase A